jgi:hypothetical protein
MANAPYTTFDFEWVRGTTHPFVMRFTQNGDPIAADDVRLSVWNKNGKTLAFRVSLQGGEIAHTDIDTGEYTFIPTAAQTRALTESKEGEDPKNRYEVEIRDGESEEVYLLGKITGTGGLNDDESGS